eukprot:CAMPEP_0182891494 /NCGR_PEP_ID=MMETSP0034_2-20130328/23286_1 /TAXON_ID=156128 /ORGANISM="Nephroselmis pyriformis, Strain CCMP717" /LENGTH=73 /DNA_ID=CAMNT_0025025101 /DNA_START=153 /DNA_END=372 /DNA_ORIENTATION=-
MPPQGSPQAGGGARESIFKRGETKVTPGPRANPGVKDHRNPRGSPQDGLPAVRSSTQSPTALQAVARAAAPAK